MLHTAVHSSTPLAFKRYHGLLNGANQSPADGLLAWERVLRVHAQADETALPVFAKTDRGNSLDDDELTDLAAQFAELKQSIVTRLQVSDAGAKSAGLLPSVAEEAPRATHNWWAESEAPPETAEAGMMARYAELHDSLRGCRGSGGAATAATATAGAAAAEARAPPGSFARQAAAASPGTGYHHCIAVPPSEATAAAASGTDSTTLVGSHGGDAPGWARTKSIDVDAALWGPGAESPSKRYEQMLGELAEMRGDAKRLEEEMEDLLSKAAIVDAAEEPAAPEPPPFVWRRSFGEMMEEAPAAAPAAAEEPPAPPPFVWRRSFGEMMEAVAPPTAAPLPVGPPTDEELEWLDAQMSKAYEAGKAYAAAAPSPAAEYYEPIPAGFEPLGAAQVQSALRSARKTYGAKQSAIRNAQSAVRRIGSGAEIRAAPPAAAPPAAAPAPAPPRPTLSRGQSSWIDPSSGELLTRL
jgi:hypothetical protein